MFSGINLIVFLMCIMPAILYSLIIYFHGPKDSIKKKPSITYLYTGLLSTTILSFVFLLFPNIRSDMFNIYIGRSYINGVLVDMYLKTIATVMFYAFVQVALFEEMCKFIALKLNDYSRGKRRKDLDSPYAIMFYCALVSGAFAIMESIDYAYRAMRGEFGFFVTPKEVLFIRTFTAVLMHMVSGVFMGYFIALAKGQNLATKVVLNIFGITTASLAHGLYDYVLMKPTSDVIYLTPTLYIQSTSMFLLCIYMLLAYIASNNLKKRSFIKC